MLINDTGILKPDTILAMIAVANGNDYRVKQLRDGVYQRGDFGGSHILQNYEHFPETTVGSYGVCDTIEQLLDKCPELESSERQFLVMVTPVRRAAQSASGGWRWHKWGNYIGTQNPQHEYLYDEKHIEEVLCFHIYERK